LSQEDHNGSKSVPVAEDIDACREETNNSAGSKPKSVTYDIGDYVTPLDSNLSPNPPSRRIGLGSAPDQARATQAELHWVNALLTHMWPELDQAALHLVDEKLLPMIKRSMPGRIKDPHFSKFTLGNDPPVVKCVEVYNLPHGSVALHVTVDYQSDLRVNFTASSRAGKLNFGMKDFGLFGELVMVVRPYMAEQPGIGGVTMYFINPPAVTLEFTGLAGAADFSFIKRLVRKAIDDAIAEKTVLPNCVTQLMRYSDFQLYPMVLGNPRPIGALRVTPLKAEDLPTRRKLGSRGNDDNNSSKYLRIAVGNEIWHAKTTQLGETKEFMVFNPEQRLHIDLWDEDRHSADDHVGATGPFHLHEAVKLSGQSIALVNPANVDKGAGFVTLKIEYFSGNAAEFGTAGSVIMVLVREVQMPATMSDVKVAITATLRKSQRTSPVCVPMRNEAREETVSSVMRDMRERLKSHGLRRGAIDKLTQADSLACNSEPTTVACNHCMMFPVQLPSELDSGELELALLEQLPPAKIKRRGLRGMFRKSNAEYEWDTLGRCSIGLQDLREAPGLMLPGPVEFIGSSKEAYPAEISVSVYGLDPAKPEVVSIDLDARRRRSAWS